MKCTNLLAGRKHITILNPNARPHEYIQKNKVEIEGKVDVKRYSEENNNTKIVENNEKSQQGQKLCKNKKEITNRKIITKQNKRKWDV